MCFEVYSVEKALLQYGINVSMDQMAASQLGGVLRSCRPIVSHNVIGTS